jgi:hypothetical protein
MTSADRDRRRRGGPAGRRRDWQGWTGPNWNGPGWNGAGSNGGGGQGWYDDPSRRSRQHNWGGDWHARGWSGDWQATAWNEADDQQQHPAPQPNDVPRKRVRIGDAERDQAVSLLSDHFVAGRLTQAEFEERSEQATKARYSDEFEALFDDLPTSRELQPVPAGPLRRRPGPPPPFLMIAPFVMIGLVISSVALAAPWLLWGVFWVVMISGISRRRWYYRR